MNDCYLILFSHCQSNIFFKRFGTSLPRYIPSEQTLAKMGIQRKISFEGTKTKPAPSSCLCQ